VPVVFGKEVSRQLLRSMLEAINGATVANGISFLKDKLYQKIFSDKINIVDRYAINRGLRSRPFDSDGLECSNNKIITSGVLNTFLLNTKYASKLNMKSTGNACGLNGIAPNNICIENGFESYGDLMKNISNGLFVTDVLGNGLNVVTGNYSQGAAGFWIQNGEIAYPVNEITIAGNFIDMFTNCSVANDLKIEYGIDSPTLFMEEMIVGGI
jgi:PmbA protein